jgi:NAD(P)H-quinone oxidoreductase subunit 5
MVTIAWSLPVGAISALVALAAVAHMFPSARPRLLLLAARLATIGAVIVASLLAWFVWNGGPVSSPTIGGSGFGFSLRLDPVSVVMFGLVAFVGAVVVRFSCTYLDGEPRQGIFVGRLCLTIACVSLLVLSGNLVQLVAAWIATSLALNSLLLFYSERPGARRAAFKKAIFARLGDACLIAAAILLGVEFGTGDISGILTRAGDLDAAAAPISLVGAGSLLMVAAALKSAQFPTHGWLTEVMEAPTPVSAILHAGVINAGGFLLIRFADVLLLAPVGMALLALLGGFTALFGSLAMLTQSQVKTSLAWSTVAQMGFMMLQCGLALFPLAMLHIVAHSLYKAHAFLSSGSAVEVVAAIRRPGPVAVPSVAAVGRAFVLALAVFVLVGAAFGFSGKSPQAIALGMMLIFGVAYLIAQGLADAAPWALTWRTTLASVAASVAYFAYQAAASWVMAGTLPPPPQPGAVEWSVIILTVLGFGSIAFAQALLPLWGAHPASAALRVHLTNGFYANALIDRWLGLRFGSRSF